MLRHTARAGVCAIYEKELKSLNPQVRNITYDVSDLYTYLEQLADISCLVCVPAPHRTLAKRAALSSRERP